MTRPPVATAGMLHRLATEARTDGATNLHVAAIVEHAGRILLLARGGDGFLDATWQTPVALVLTGDTLFEALHRSLAHTGLTLGAVTGYLGHYDNVVGRSEFVRVLHFAIDVPDPHSICRNPTIGHLWTRPDELPNNTMPPPRGVADSSVPRPRYAPTNRLRWLHRFARTLAASTPSKPPPRC